MDHLYNVFKSVNTLATFMRCRKHVLPTVKNLSCAHKDITDEHFAMFKYLLPEDISYVWVDAEQYSGDQRDVFDIEEDGDNWILMFDFIDGDLKPQPAKKRKVEDQSGVKGEDRVKVELDETVLNLTNPRENNKRDKQVWSFSVDDMGGLVAKRNAKFKEAAELLRSKMKTVGYQGTEIDYLKEKIEIPKVPTFGDVVNMDREKAAAQNQEMVDVTQLITDITTKESYSGQIVENGYMIVPAEEARYGELEYELNSEIKAAFEVTKGVTKLFTHQAEALNALHRGQNVVVCTPTSSGKSLIYQTPVLESLLNNSSTRAFFIFPTKALAQDQKRSLTELALALGFEYGTVETFDGDTPFEKRCEIRDRARVVFTNPDMMHVSILPKLDAHRSSWRQFIQNLRYVVVDEIHYYNSLFGTHVSLVLRRLRRVCKLLGNDTVQFISCSATISKPLEHMSNLFGLDQETITLVDSPGGAHGLKHVLAWNTPYVSPEDPRSGRASVVGEAIALLSHMVKANIRTIVFCRVRVICEQIIKGVRQRFVADGRPDLSNVVMSYRGGYSPQDRRKIEQDMFSGSLIGIVATNALELGIDIGQLDACIIAGFPMTVSNLRQQSGRAGRRKDGSDSLTIVIGSGDPVDQFYMNNPDKMLTEPTEALTIEPLTNLLLLESHVQCAANEFPIELSHDEEFFGPLLHTVKDKLIEDKSEETAFYHTSSRFSDNPAKDVSIRGIEENHYAVVDITQNRGHIIELLEESRVPFTLYEGGIFMHQGFPHLVVEVNVEDRIGKVRRVNVDWYTRQRDFTDTDPVKQLEAKQLSNAHGAGKVSFGDIRITTTVFGFFKFDKRDRVMEAVEVDHPPFVINTKGFWIDIPQTSMKLIEAKKLSLAGAIHAAEHALINFFPRYVVCGPGDVRTECKAPEKEFAKRQSTRIRPARLIFGDKVGGEGGSGLSQKAFQFVEEIINNAVDGINACECEWGCHSCVAGAFCTENGLVLSKPGAQIILSKLAGRDIDWTKVKEGPEPNMPIAEIITIE
ncbi:ATP-dependent helicase HRQ1 [Yarrowia sp. B02]|nr:ATP-dependent helicase HRQ1 [Yarrowia sp. B02]